MTEITEEFLERVVGEPISEFLTSAGSQLGDNVGGNLLAIDVKTKSGQHYNLVYKGIAVNPQGQGWARKLQIFKVENMFYEKLAPRISSFLKSMGGAGKGIPIPKFFSGSWEINEEFLCLEDIRLKGYIMPDKYKGLNLAETTLLMKEIAHFHASTYALVRHQGEQIFDEDDLNCFTGMMSKRDPMFIKFGIIKFGFDVKNAIEVLKSRNLDDYASRVQSKILDQGDEHFERAFGSTRNLTDAKLFPCIVHGDFWSNNTLIKYEPDGNADNPVDMQFIDFQMTRRGNVLEDLNYFLMASTTPSLRKEHLSTVLNIYYDNFRSTLEDINVPCPVGFSREFFIEAYHKELLSTYIFMCFAIPLQLAEPIDHAAEIAAAAETAAEGGGPPPEPQGDMWADMEKAAMMLEGIKKGMEVESKVMLGQMLKSPAAIDRLVDITREFIELGVL